MRKWPSGLAKTRHRWQRPKRHPEPLRAPAPHQDHVPSEPLKWEPPEPVKCYVCNGTGGYEILEEVEWRSRCDCDRYTHARFHDHNDCKLEITYRRRVVTCFMCDGKGAY